MSRKQEKVISLIMAMASEFINREASKKVLITVTGADISPNLHDSTIYITVFPEDKEKDSMDFLKRKRSDLREFVRSHSKLRVLPVFDFEIDLGEKNRQRIDELSR
jgi:ribosome-binding factor A